MPKPNYVSDVNLSVFHRLLREKNYLSKSVYLGNHCALSDDRTFIRLLTLYQNLISKNNSYLTYHLLEQYTIEISYKSVL